jgi:hypothetical protein
LFVQGHTTRHVWHSHFAAHHGHLGLTGRHTAPHLIHGSATSTAGHLTHCIQNLSGIAAGLDVLTTEFHDLG